MKQEKILLILIVILILTINYSWIDSFLVKAFEEDYEIGIVDRIVDGDTIIVNESSVRLLGINSPEKGEIGYNEAKNFLEEEILEKEVKIYFGSDKTDRYGRKLCYVFLGTNNINLQSVREGYSNFYFPSGKDKYYNQFVKAWEDCLNKEIGLCKKSLEKCIILDEWDIKKQVVVLKNICNYEIDLTNWSIKDEGRKKYVFKNEILKGSEIIELGLDDWDENYVWTSSGDSIFVRDSENKLVIFDTY
jgi:micrococcal nuclease